MQNKLTVFSLFLVVTLLQSCSFDTPEDYFNRTTLNVNKHIDVGAKDFQHMVEVRDQNALYALVDGEFKHSDSFEAHVRTYKLTEMEKDIERIEALQPTDETEDMINASLTLFKSIKTIYETDYIEIAKLMDQQAPQEEINQVIKTLEEQELPQINTKLEALYSIAIPYAEANGIQVSFF